ncbi:MAG: hypothetical protein OXN81_20725 [Alphaproteobacteria bacterium]|nr:hypothetical protein [Alphaproteobacteria bacterium]
MPARKAFDNPNGTGEILGQLSVGRLADDDKQRRFRAYDRLLLVRPVVDAPVSGYGKPTVPADLRQPFFVSSVMPEEVRMSSHLKTGSLQDIRENTAKVPVGKKYHTQAALS